MKDVAWAIGSLVYIAFVLRFTWFLYRGTPSQPETEVIFLALGRYGEELHEALSRERGYYADDFAPDEEVELRSSWAKRLALCVSLRAAYAKRMKLRGDDWRFAWEGKP